MTSVMRVPRRVPEYGPRALETLPEVPAGCFTVNIDGTRHHPHLRHGEIAVIDATQREIEWGELYAIRQSNGPCIWQVCRTPKLYGGGKRPTAMMHPLNRPHMLSNGELDWSGPVHMSDGPIYLDALARLILGRVIGILDEPAYDPDRGAEAPSPNRITLPNIRPEDELRWRYLEWLTQERKFLAQELGASGRLGIYSLADRFANLFFSQSLGPDEKPGERAERVLAAAGVSVEPDPHWAGLVL